MQIPKEINAGSRRSIAPHQPEARFLRRNRSNTKRRRVQEGIEGGAESTSGSVPVGAEPDQSSGSRIVAKLIDMLLESSEKRECELIMAVLDMACECSDGRAELLKHGAGLAVVSKKILRVSQAASERAVRILHSVSKYSATAAVLAEMLQIGVVGKLCLVLQVDCGSKTKERTREILRSHAKAWRNSICIPNNLISAYPS